MSKTPPDRTVVLKGINANTTKPQLMKFLNNFSPNVQEVFLVQDKYPLLEPYNLLAYLGFESSLEAHRSKDEIAKAVLALKDKSDEVDFSQVITYMKEDIFYHQKVNSSPVPFTIWVANIVDEDSNELKVVFETFGKLCTSSIHGVPPLKIFESSNRSVIVNFVRFEDARAVVEACDNRQLLFGKFSGERMYASAQPYSTTKFIMNLLEYFKKVQRRTISLKEAEQTARSLREHAPPRWMDTILCCSEMFNVDINHQNVSLKDKDSHEEDLNNSEPQIITVSGLVEKTSNDISVLFRDSKNGLEQILNVPAPVQNVVSPKSEPEKDASSDSSANPSSISLNRSPVDSNPNSFLARLSDGVMSSPLNDPIATPLVHSNTLEAHPYSIGGCCEMDQWTVDEACDFLRVVCGLTDESGARVGGVDGKTLLDLLDDAEGRALILKSIDQGGMGLRPLQMRRLQAEVKSRKPSGCSTAPQPAQAMESNTLLASDLMNGSSSLPSPLGPAAPSDAISSRSAAACGVVGDGRPVIPTPGATGSSVAGVSMGSADVDLYTLDPISGFVMQDPVTAADGVTYDRASLEAWLAARGAVSPSTGRMLPTPVALVPNKAVRAFVARLHPDVDLRPWRL